MSKETRAAVLEVLGRNVYFDKVTRPLMLGVSLTTASLARCFSGENKKISYPNIK